jgi:hypothetical protein
MILATQIPILTARLKAAVEGGYYQGVTAPAPGPVRLLVEQLEQLGYSVTLERVAA